ncbi:MAG: hypothetical protein HY784_09350, partial [Chloroflexi bacterium]|nr:hypothetical protein [Chloroflexota bacterium]
LPEISTWRANGGLLLSESLGSPAIKRFYDAAYNGKLVARDALLAGNDLLYLSQFQTPGDADEFATITATLAFFAQKYNEDAAFAQRVDEALLRVLELKFRLYPRFATDLVLKRESALDEVGRNEASVFEVAKKAVTLISPPSAAELADRLPDPPQLGEPIVFISDVRTSLQCSTCAPTPLLSAEALQQAVLRLYGPQGSGEVQPASLLSFSFEELQAFLDGVATPPTTGEGTPPAPIPIQAALDRA